MLLTTLVVAACHCLTAVAQVPPTLEVTTYDKSSVVPGFIYLAPNTVPFAGPYVFDLNGVSHQSALGTDAATEFPVVTLTWRVDHCVQRCRQTLRNRPRFPTVRLSEETTVLRVARHHCFWIRKRPSRDS